MKKSGKNSYCLQEVLDSDDELPTECDEIAFIPAYQNDNRFQYLEERKNNNEDLYKLHIRGNGLHYAEEFRRKKERRSKNSYAKVLLGYLNKKDTFCLQSLNTNKTTLLWFLNFLVLKDLQSSYTFLTTCLVSDYIDKDCIY